ncbi:MAG: hypothetical protein L3V56_14795, partial [Candidatus Magnetoovum sp. WYHC-5]|nr:hypothetical protein [Candidatus Magnetoovum sp. WYHC-5]
MAIYSMVYTDFRRLSSGTSVKNVSPAYNVVTTNFTGTTYTVTPSAGTGGTITPSTPQTVTSGLTTQFTVTPNSGYNVNTVSGCSDSLSGTTYT